MIKEGVEITARFSKIVYLPIFLVVNDAFKNAGITVRKQRNISTLEEPVTLIIILIILALFFYIIIIFTKENQLKMKIGFIVFGLILIIIL